MLCDGFVSVIKLYVVLSTLFCLLAVLFLATARDCCGAVDSVLNVLVEISAFSCVLCVTSSSTLDVYSTYGKLLF